MSGASWSGYYTDGKRHGAIGLLVCQTGRCEEDGHSDGSMTIQVACEHVLGCGERESNEQAQAILVYRGI